MTPVKYLFLFFLISSSVLAQQLSHPVMVSRDDAFSAPRQFRITADTIDILAVVVQFQQDNTPLTSGDGRFDLTQGTNPIIEAPPHNKQYFLDHFTFVANYFRKTSKGKVVVRATVLDSVITLPRPMQDYAPPRIGSTIAVGNLVRDTWQKVDSAGLVSNFSQYECFVVLHAGTGRDIDLVSLLGYDPTPYDIPSLYIGLNGFRQYYGSGYQGITVNGGSFRITNSIVIPESENRLLPTVTGTTLLELSINGLLCASVGNFLGLPDLFDTNTGRSGIGRFGLMDGQAIFSFKGVFPPEPSAWEKYWLGWVQPVTLQAVDSAQAVSLPAVGLATARGLGTEDVVYRVPISAQEYFLIENRNRDPHDRPQEAGQKVYSVFSGASRMQPFPRDTVGFNAFEIDSLAGVVTDVEDFDWSLPGGVDQNNTFYDGGVLIWHIDEAAIAQGLQANGVNANPNRRGVDLEEADGSQDIGQSYEFLSPGSGSEEGTALDFWYQQPGQRGNGSPVNTNIFSSTSHPDSRSNSGANSHITIRDFSARGSHMTAKVILGDDVVKLLPGFPKSTGEKISFQSLSISNLSGQGTSDIMVGTTGEPIDFNSRANPPAASGVVQSKLYAWRPNGSGVLPTSRSSGLFAMSAGPLPLSSSTFGSPPSVADLNGDGIADVTTGEFNTSSVNLRAFSSRDLNTDSLADDLYSTRIGSGFAARGAVVADSIIALSGSNGRVYFFKYDGSIIDSLQAGTVPADSVIGISRAAVANSFIITNGVGTIRITFRKTTGGTTRPDLIGATLESIPQPAVAAFFGSSLRIAFVTRRDNLYLIDDNLNTISGFPIHISGASLSLSPALADVDGDGSRDIVLFVGNRIHVYNRSGASLDNFPLAIPTNSHINSAPVVADLDGDGNTEIVAVAEDGLVAAYDKSGRMKNGFPLQAGTGSQSVAVFVQRLPLNSLAIDLAVASSNTGSVIAWQIATISFASANLPWPQYQKDAQHSGLALEPLTGTPLSSEFFPKGRAYNWPNPVYEGRTFIRYFVKDNATVNIKVFDLAGDLVATILNPPGVGGVDNEVEWKVGDVESGIYFARIEANGGGGSGVAVVKIAVVK